MFKDEDLRAEIAEEFEGLQEQFAGDVRASLSPAKGHPQHDAWHGEVNPGFRVFNPNPPKSPERKAALRTYMRKHKLDIIREALLRGERPKQQTGKRGRPATRWMKVAKELGIDLTLPPEAPKPAA